MGVLAAAVPLILGALLCSCGGEPRSAETEIRDAIERVTEAAEKGDAAAVRAFVSERYRDEVDSDFDAETGVELCYQAALLPWLALTPDLQLIVDPGGDRAADDAFVATLRVRVAF